MAQIQENFDKFCRRWGTNVWPDFSRNLTHSHYSRRGLDQRSRLSVRQANEDRVVPVCEAVVSASRGQKRMRGCENVENAIERLAASHRQWHELSAVQERVRNSDRSNVTQLMNGLREVMRHAMRSRLMASQLETDLTELQHTQEAAVAKVVDAVGLPANTVVVASSELTAWREEQAELARLEDRSITQRAMDKAAMFERRRLSNVRVLEEAEQAAVMRSHPEFELFVLEEKLIREAYPPPDPRRRRTDSGQDRRGQRERP